MGPGGGSEDCGEVRAGHLPSALPLGTQNGEIFDVLVEQTGVCIERIVSSGQATPQGQWYDQERDEFVLLVSGAARLRIEGEGVDRPLAPGDWLLLPAHCRHRVTWTQSDPATIWLAIHYDTEPAGP